MSFFQEVEWGAVDWIDLAQDRDRWRSLVNTAMNFFFTVVPCILIISKYFIYQLMHNRVALKEY